MDFVTLGVLCAYHIIVNDMIIARKQDIPNLFPWLLYIYWVNTLTLLIQGTSLFFVFNHARVVRSWFPTLACNSCVASRNRPIFCLFHYLRSLICFGRVFRICSGGQRWRSSESIRLPPIWPRFDFQNRRHIWVEFVGSLLCCERFSPGYNCFRTSLSSKTCIWWNLICIYFKLQCPQLVCHNAK